VKNNEVTIADGGMYLALHGVDWESDEASGRGRRLGVLQYSMVYSHEVCRIG